MNDLDDSLTALLSALQNQAPDDVPLARIALFLAARRLPPCDLTPYLDYLDTLAARVRARRAEDTPEDDLNADHAALCHVLVAEDHYHGDSETYHDLQNANLIRVIDRRCGLPITLGLLYHHAAHGAGMNIEGVNFPGHFLLRLGAGSHTCLIDPFHEGRIMTAPDLRDLLKKIQGPGAELSASYYQTLSPRDLLIRLENNVKRRQIEMGDYHAALRTLETMRQIDPREPRVWLDAGVLYARIGARAQACENLIAYIEHFPIGHPNRREAEALLKEIEEI